VFNFGATMYWCVTDHHIPTLIPKKKDNQATAAPRELKPPHEINPNIPMPLSRLILSYSANVYTRVITGLPLRDATGGYKCFRRRALEAVNLDKVKSDGYAFQIEMSYKCWRKGFKIREIPITFVDRRAGVSKMNQKIVWEAAWMVWRLRWWSITGRV